MRIAIVALILLTTISFAQKRDIEKQDLIEGKVPENLFTNLPTLRKWMTADKALIFMSKGKGESMRNHILDLRTGEVQEAPSSLDYQSKSPSKSLIIKNGDLYLKTPLGEEKLTNDPSDLERNPEFSPDSNFVAYTKNNNIFCLNLKTKIESQLTIDGSKTTLNGFATWVYWEEIFGRTTRFRAFWWSPDSRTIAYMRFDESKTKMFPIYNSEGQHGYIEETRYPKAGDSNPTVKLGFVKIETSTTKWADFKEFDEQYLGWPEWMPDGSGLMVQWINRGNDNLKLFNVNPSSGSKTLLYEEKQDSWINIDEAEERLTVLDNGKEMIIISDKSGWKQLNLHDISGKFKNAITSGKFTVKSVIGIDQKSRVIYFHARGLENSARFDLYKVGLDGKNLKRLTFGDFNHKNIEASPDFKYFISTYSNNASPFSMVIFDNNGKIIKNLGSTKGSEFENFNLSLPKYQTIKSDDGKYDLPMNIIYPENMIAGKKYPVLVSIYGGPDAGTVYDQWSWTVNNQLLAREGLIQVSFDHRASGHFGKEGVATMHRNLGHFELTDYATMVKYLVDKGIADPTKICITGFSYGGYMSCLAITKYPEVFTHAMAGGSVTSWELYDSAYTERFMDTPKENPEGYKKSSVLSYVDNYKGKLLIVHGTSDDNVHLQNSLQLIDALETKKKNFEMMFYPGGKHGWGGAKGQHFDNLKTKFIYQNLLEKSIPEGLLK